MCLNKIINELKEPCPLNCGKNIKRGDMQLHLKDCPERLYECNECGKELKKSEFNKHIA